MTGEERDGWIASLEAEMASLIKLGVKEDITKEQLYERYWSKGIQVKRMPTKMVTIKKPIHDGKGGWKKKSRLCVCGNFEEGFGGALKNRAEVPSTFEMRTILALGQRHAWGVGSLDVSTAFLYAELVEEEDGVIVVYPPPILIRLGLVQPGVMWLLKKALYGLRVAPKRWGLKRDDTMTSMKVDVEGEEAELIQRNAAKGLWKIVLHEQIIGYLIVYVDDVLITGPLQ